MFRMRSIHEVVWHDLGVDGEDEAIGVTSGQSALCHWLFMHFM
jgi:hypothetical protein